MGIPALVQQLRSKLVQTLTSRRQARLEAITLAIKTAVPPTGRDGDVAQSGDMDMDIDQEADEEMEDLVFDLKRYADVGRSGWQPGRNRCVFSLSPW